MSVQNVKERIKGFIRKYRGLSKFALEELRHNGYNSLVFAIRRHIKKRKGSFPVVYPTVNDYEKGLVTIGILSVNHLELIKPCIESIEENLSQKYKIEIIIGDTGSRDKSVRDFYAEAKKKWENIRIAEIGKYFFSKNYNDLVRKYAKGEYLIFLNNDTIVKGNWIDELVDPLQDKKIGIVGAKLLYENETIQHAGMEFSENNALAVFAKEKKDFPEAGFKAYVPVVTFACAATRHDVFDRFKLGEDFYEEAQDTDFCLRLEKAGFRTLYNPGAEIFHLECSSRDWRKGEWDRIWLKKKWGRKIAEMYRNGNQRKKFDPDEHKNSIVVIRDDGIGDILMGMSAFQNLREKYPEKKIIFATYERNVEMVRGFRIFDDFILIPDGQKYAPLPIPHDAKVFNLIDLEMDFSPTHGIPKEDNKTNRHFTFSKKLGLENKFELIKIPDYPEALKKIDAILQKEGAGKSKHGLVALNFFSANPARSWWEPYYGVLIKELENMGFTPVILGIKESDFFKSKNAVNLVGKTKTIAEYIEAIKSCKYVISTDTSAYHIAALAGIPFLAIFTGGMTPESRLSLYEKYEVLAPPETLKCYPCWDEGCKDLSIRWRKDPCRTIIKPETVIEKFKELVKKYPR